MTKEKKGIDLPVTKDKIGWGYCSTSSGLTIYKDMFTKTNNNNKKKSKKNMIMMG